MADVSEEYNQSEAFRRSMAQATDPRQIAMHAHDSIGTLLLAILSELRDLKDELRAQSHRGDQG